MTKSIKTVSPQVPAAWDFFVSYTQSDRAWAEWIVWVLKENGYSCFAQFADIPPGADFVQEMNVGLRNSRQIIAILTPAYLKSSFATSELNAALGLDPVGSKRRLVPVRVKKCTPTGMLFTRVYIDLVGREASDAPNILLKGIEASRIAVSSGNSTFCYDRPPKCPLEGTVVTHHSMSAQPHPTHAEQVKILFIASQRGTGLQLRTQAKAIERALREVIKFGGVIFDVRYDVEAEDLAEVINDTAPNIVHFSGKQNGQKILVPAASGGVTTIAAKALTGLFLNLADTVRLVIVDTCRSLPSAVELRTTVDYAIGVEGDIYDADAINFYTQLYSSLAKGLSLKKSVGQARAVLELQGVPKTDIPALFCHDDANPAAFHFARSYK